MPKRIITISSGKGGVGKTSFAINLSLCLSRYGKTVLLDLDTGTSSIRNTIDVPVRKDLYHFFKKDEPLQNCITGLDKKLDPSGNFSNFGFIASPKHMIDAIANMNLQARNRLIDAINGLKAQFIILDLKAGLDPAVIDFMPHSNSGILVFTPNHPAATLAASDIAKAILFRELRELFHRGSAIYNHFRGIDAREINRMIDQTEDVYDDRLPNLDFLLAEMSTCISNPAFVKVLHHIVQRFQVYYVLNRFDGIESSFQTAVKPLVENIYEHISSKVNINNLGWIVESQKYNMANLERKPYLLTDTYRQQRLAAASVPRMEREMNALYELAGIKKTAKPALRKTPKTATVLDGQLKAIQALYQAKKGETVRQNFEYVLSCLKYLFDRKRLGQFGASRILKKGELVPLILAQKKQRESRALSN